jgi:hypothetical protein
VDNDPVTFWLKKVPQGMSIQNGSIVYTPSWDATGKHVVTIAATDSRDTTIQQYILNVHNVNNPPEIISLPPLAVSLGEVYRYQVETHDPDNDVPAYSLVSAPAGMLVSQNGCITWPDNGNRMNNASVTVRAVDDSGAYDEQFWNIAIVPDTVKPQVSISINPNPVFPGDLAIVTVTASDNASVRSVVLFVDNTAVTLDGNRQYVIHTTDEDTLECRAEVVDISGNSSFAEYNLIISNEADNTPPQVSLSTTPNEPLVGQQMAFTVTATDNSGIDTERLWLFIDGKNIPVTNNVAYYTPLKKGMYLARATAYDMAGNFDDTLINFYVAFDGPDTSNPVAIISAPYDTTILTTTPVTGTATDENFAFYTLSYYRVGSTDTVEFYRSETPCYRWSSGHARSFGDGKWKLHYFTVCF